MGNRIDLTNCIQVATALALLAAMILSSQSSRFDSRSALRDQVRSEFASVVTNPPQLCAATVSARTDRMKAVSPEKEREPGRPIYHARGIFDLDAALRAQPLAYPTDFGSVRPHNPLRC